MGERRSASRNTRSCHRLSWSSQAGGCGYTSAGRLKEIPKPRTETQQRAETGGVRGVEGLRKQPRSGQESCSVEEPCLKESRETAHLTAGNGEAERKRVTVSLCPHAPAASHGGLDGKGRETSRVPRAVGISYHHMPRRRLLMGRVWLAQPQPSEEGLENCMR